MKILVFGLPGSGKSTLGHLLASQTGARYFDGDVVRLINDDWDFTHQGRINQAHRMRNYADRVVVKKEIAICCFVAPLRIMRQILNPNITIFCNRTPTRHYSDTSIMFEPPYPNEIDYTTNDDTNINKLVGTIYRDLCELLR